jgi:hypothetical protein
MFIGLMPNLEDSENYARTREDLCAILGRAALCFEISLPAILHYVPLAKRITFARYCLFFCVHLIDWTKRSFWRSIFL